MRDWRLLGVAVLVALVALTARLPGLGEFMTVDEERWMLRSGEFWHKLFRQADPGGTFVTSHPGAVTTWLSGAGIVWQESRLGFDIDTSNLRHFRLAASLPMALAAAGMIGVIAWLFGRLLNWWVGLIGGVLLATEPYLVGMSQIVHVDMLLGLFMAAAVLCSLLYWRERRIGWLLWCGGFAGLAMAEKLLPALWLWVYFAAMFGVGSCRRWNPPIPPSKGGDDDGTPPTSLIRGGNDGRTLPFPLHRGWISRMMRRLGIIVGAAGLTFYLAWPALWVKTNLDDYYVRDVEVAVQDRHVEIEETETAAQINPASFYVRTVLGRASPPVLLMSAGILMLFLRYVIERQVLRRPMRLRKNPPSPPYQGGDDGGTPLAPLIRGETDRRFIPISVIGWLLAFAVSFLAFVTVPAKQADRYALPALVMLPLLAGIGWYIVFRLVLDWLARRGEECAACRVLKPLMAILAGLVLLLRPAAAAPHAIAYNNPWFPDIRPASQQGWGEGLESAAAWLNEHPAVDRLYIASWYPSVTATYFNGKTLSLSSRDDDRVGYVLVYRNMYGRAPDAIASNVLDEFRGREPVHVVPVLGAPYVWIYETLGIRYFRQHVGELAGEMEVGQTVPIVSDEFSALEIGFATFSGRENTQEVILHVRESIDATEDVRTVRVNARDIADDSYHRFDFAPIAGAAGKTFYVSLTSPDSRPGDAVTVRFIDQNLLPGEMLLRREALPPGGEPADFVREGDIAYRVPVQ